jgi:hypothetical protein
MVLLTLSKSLAIASPFFIKIAVDALAEISILYMNMSLLGILGFGASRILSCVFQELRMNKITEII